MTQKEVASFLGCSESTISQYESGKRRPDYETLLKLGELLHLSSSELLGESKRNPLTPLQRQLLDAIEGLPDEDVRILIEIAKRFRSPRDLTEK